MEDICRQWRVTDEEYEALDRKFGLLCYDQSHDLQKKNYRNNYTDEFEDIVQNQRMAMIRAGCYYKRQVYIEASLAAVREHAADEFTVSVLGELEHLWDNKTKHGANKQKFGPHQEALLDQLVVRCVPEEARPDPARPLQIDRQFEAYCKSVTWNSQKNQGKKITRERSIRAGQVSLSYFDFASYAV